MKTGLTLFLLYLLLWFPDFTIKNLQYFIKIYRALIKDIFLLPPTLNGPLGTEHLPTSLLVRVVRNSGVIVTPSRPLTTCTVSTASGRPC